MNELQFIVETLNRPPFSLNTSLVGFSSKSPIELLQVVNDVLAEIDPKQRKDLREEVSDTTAVRIIEFLMVLNYKHNMDILEFRDAVMGGRTDVVYALLQWLLSRLPDLKKRAYVARFLRNVEIPEEYFADEEIVTMYQRLKELQGEFTDVHKQVDKMRGSTLNPGELQKEIIQLETEKEQLTNKMGRLRDKVQEDARYHSVSFDKLLKATQNLRVEQEEESRLLDSFEEQKQHLMMAESRMQVLSRKVQDLRSTDSNEDPRQLLEKLRNEVEETRNFVELRQAAELQTALKELASVQSVFSVGALMGQEDIEVFEADIAQKSAEVAQLTQNRDQLQSSLDSKIGFYRDRANAVEQKLEKMKEAMKDLEDEKRDALVEISKLDAEMKALNIDGSKPKTEAQMKQYMQELTEKTNLFKSYKNQLQVIRNEITVLQRTEEILRSRDQNIVEFNLQLEKEKGIVGFQATQENLEQVSAAKSEIDKSKGQTLDEMSAVVVEITNVLKERKTKLAPQIKELRSVRLKHTAAEAEFLEAKTAHSNAVAGLEAERAKLEQETIAAETALREDESLVQLLKHQSTVLAAKEIMAREEGAPRTSKTHSTALEEAVREHEAVARALRTEQKKLKESHNENLEQRNMFKALKSLLEVKRRVQQEKLANDELEAMNEHRAMNYGDPSMGVDRLIIE